MSAAMLHTPTPDGLAKVKADMERRTQTLKSDLDSMKVNFDHWAGKQLKQMEVLKKAHAEAMQTGKDQLATLKTKEDALKNETAQGLKRLEEQLKGVEALKTAVQDLKAKEEETKPKLTSLENQMKEKKAVAEKKKEELSNIELDVSYRKNELSRGVSFYEQYLGLSFERIGDEKLRFVFTCIDPANVDRRFSFTVTVNEKRQYEVKDCKPHVTDLPHLVSDLCESNDFAKFILGMRKRFQAMV
eukprot:GFYU01004299.1.p1 GENE.GFYU01004299.1~~GFYU01004299.1.p1  ORF type:complete len:256 (-),score=92.24 GFYU01004299.1:398-1129(-)